MPSDPVHLGPVRSAAVVNGEIRALMRRTGGWLSADDRAEYELLVEEWAAATATERSLDNIVTAA